MKRTASIILCAVLALTALMLSSCGVITELINSVNYPDSYSLTYEVTTAEGSIYTLTKTIDKNGNVYIKTEDKEQLYLNDNGKYTLYEKNEDGEFVTTDDQKYTKKSVEEATSAIDQYAKESQNKLMPTAKNAGEGEVAGRTCDVYKLGVGGDNNGAYYYYFVDTETGICLGVEVQQTALGQELDYDGESFVCTELITENVEDLSTKIK